MRPFRKEGVVPKSSGGLPARFLVRGNVVTYSSGPKTVLIEFIDSQSERHSVPMANGATYRLPPGRHYTEVLVYNLDPVTSTVEVLLGSGDLDPGNGIISTPEALRIAISGNFGAATSGTTYYNTGIQNPSGSKVVAEVLKIQGTPSNSGGHALIHGTGDASSVFTGGSGVGFTPMPFTDNSLGTSAFGLSAVSGATGFNILGVQTWYFRSIGGGPSNQPYTLDFTAAPLLIRPGEYISMFPLDGSLGVAAQAGIQMGALFIARERAE